MGEDDGIDIFFKVVVAVIILLATLAGIGSCEHGYISNLEKQGYHQYKMVVGGYYDLKFPDPEKPGTAKVTLIHCEGIIDGGSKGRNQVVFLVGPEEKEVVVSVASGGTSRYDLTIPCLDCEKLVSDIKIGKVYSIEDRDAVVLMLREDVEAAEHR